MRKMRRRAKNTIKSSVKLGHAGLTFRPWVFKVGDKSMLAKVAAGHKIRFLAERVEGALTVTTLELAK